MRVGTWPISCTWSPFASAALDFTRFSDRFNNTISTYSAKQRYSNKGGLLRCRNKVKIRSDIFWSLQCNLKSKWLTPCCCVAHASVIHLEKYRSLSKDFTQYQHATLFHANDVNFLMHFDASREAAFEVSMYSIYPLEAFAAYNLRIPDL